MGAFYEHYLSEEQKFTKEYVARHRGFYEMERVIKRDTLMAGKERLSVERPKILKFDVWEEASKQGEHNVLPALINEVLGPSSITYLDIEAELIEAAKVNNGTDNRHYFVGNVQRLPFDPSSFDVVIDFSTTDHIVDDKGFAQAISGTNGVLKPGGLYLLYHDNAEYLHAEAPGDWSRPRSIREVTHALEAGGFKVEAKRFIYPIVYDRTLRWHKILESSKALRRAIPDVLKHRFFNLSRFNAIFFIVARCVK